MVDSKINENKSNVILYIKAIMISLVITMLLILIFAFVLKFSNLSDKFITPINMIIKAISVIIGTIILTKGGRGGLIKGLILGVAFSLVSFIIFSLMLAKFSLSFGLILDIGFCGLVGAISGAVSVNMKNI